jgi:hypothetical protein
VDLIQFSLLQVRPLCFTGALPSATRLKSENMAARFRIRGKQPECAVRNGSPKKVKRSVSALRLAVQQGLLPKARKPFALFTADFFKKDSADTSTLGKRIALMKQAAQAWRALSEVNRASINAASTDEFKIQRRAAQQLGLVAVPPCLDEVAPVAARAASVQLGEFTVLDTKPLGEGTYGTVVKALHRQAGRFVAIKIFKDPEGELQREVLVYKALADLTGVAGNVTGPCSFLRLVHFEVHGSLPYMVMPWVASGSMADRLKAHGRLQGDHLHLLMAQVASGLKHLHTVARFLHCDVKPGNVLWNPVEVAAYLCDFGCAQLFPLRAGTDVGTCFFSAPFRHPDLYRVPAAARDAQEYIKKTLAPRMDWWAAGCTFFEAASGQPMFPTVDAANRNKKCHPRVLIDRYVSEDASARKVRFAHVPAKWRGALQQMLSTRSSPSFDWDVDVPDFFTFP